MKKYRSLVEANYSVVKSDDRFTLKSKDSSSSPVEASYSKSVQLLAICKSKCPLLVEANHSTVKLNDLLNFHTNSSPMEANNSKSVPFGPAKPTV